MRASKNQFRFKQFTIAQDQCAMKVCTDSCIFGAYIEGNNATKILDIGTGTGLLSLMLAQRCQVPITAIEIEPKAATQALKNVQNSPWAAQITVINQAIQKFSEIYETKFELIISNPPFFQQNLKSPIDSINDARHNESLSLDELATCVSKLLAINGSFWVMLPAYEMEYFTNVLYRNFIYKQTQLIIRHGVGKPTFRVICSFGWSEKIVLQDEFIINAENEGYSDRFKALLGAYYLNV